jgi:DNA transformation protein and related proteins
MADTSFHNFVRELFDGVGRVEVKRMFGGAGAWCDGVMFLLIADDTIHIKVDDALKAELRAEGCGPFVWEPQSGPRAGEKIDLGYWRLPDAALDDPDEAAVWGRKALAVAKAKAKAKKPAKKAAAKAKPTAKPKAKPKSKKKAKR